MKRIVKKRIVLYCPWDKQEIIGAEEYDKTITDENILGAYHEIGKTIWLPTYPGEVELWYLKEHNGVRIPYYRVEVDEFYITIPSFWDKVKNALR